MLRLTGLAILVTITVCAAACSAGKGANAADARSYLEMRDFPDARSQGARALPSTPVAVSPFVKPEWIDERDKYESRRYSQGFADGSLVFRVEDAGKAMRWLWPLSEPVDAKERSTLVVSYRADGVVPEKGKGYETVLWLRDGRPYGGFFSAILPEDITADGTPRELRLDLRRCKPVGPLTEVCIEVRNAGSGPAVFEIASLDFVAQPAESVSVLDGKPFKAMTEWARGGNVSKDFSHAAEPGMAVFEIRDPRAHMKWALEFDEPIDWRKLPVVEFEYNATGVIDDGYEYLVWLFDGRPEHAAGFEAIIPREIIADGRPHKFYVRLARFNVAAPITGAAVRVLSGDEGPATFMITRLTFLPEWPADAHDTHPAGYPPAGE